MTEVNNRATKHVLLTGATGYVGGRLLKELEKQGYRVRCIPRRPEHLKSRISDYTEVVQGDVLAAESLKSAFKDIDVCILWVPKQHLKSKTVRPPPIFQVQHEKPMFSVLFIWAV